MSDDISAINLFNAIRKINEPKKQNNMIFGEVTSVEPLKIDIGNNVILTKDFLYLGQMCRPHKVKIPHTHQYNGKTEDTTLGTLSVTGSGVGNLGAPVAITGTATFNGTDPHNHEIKEQVTEDVHKQGTDYEESVTLEIEPKLKVGDIVLLFAMNDNQLYYVAERVEGKK